MSWYGNFLAGLAPDYQLRRLKAMTVTRMAHEAAKPGRNNRAKRETRGPNASMLSDAKNLREQVRHLEQNSDAVVGALDILVANTIGAGVRPEPMVKNKAGELIEDVNERLMSLWTDWARRPEVTWTLDEFSAQRLAARSLYRDGEVLRQDIVGRSPRLNHGTLVPYSYELIEADMLNDLRTDLTRNIINGVEMNDWGRVVAFHLFKNLQSDVGSTSLEDKRVSADNFIHLKLTRRIRQARGVTAFAPVLKRLTDIEDIDESERIASRVAAAMAWYIKKGDPSIYTAPDTDGDTTGERMMDLYPGMGFDDLRPGEDIGTIASNRPNNSLIPYLEYQQRRLAGGVGTSFSSLSKNYNGTYSAQRQELVEQRVLYTMMWNYFVERSERPKWERFVEAAVLANLVELPKETDQGSIADCDFAQVPMPWIQPEQEASAYVTLIDNELESRSNIIRMRGRDPREVRRQIELEGGPIKKDAQPSDSVDSKEPNELEDFRVSVDAYGVGVRAGVITPQTEDEDHFRQLAGVPPAAAAVKQVWAKEQTRRPITLVQEKDKAASGNTQPPDEQNGEAEGEVVQVFRNSAGRGPTQIRVEGAQITVAAPTIQNDVHVPIAAPPIVNVQPPNVTVTNELPEYEETEAKALRDEKGQLTGTLTTKRRRK